MLLTFILWVAGIGFACLFILAVIASLLSAIGQAICGVFTGEPEEEGDGEYVVVSKEEMRRLRKGLK